MFSQGSVSFRKPLSPLFRYLPHQHGRQPTHQLRFRTAEATGRTEEVRSFAREFNNVKWMRQGEAKGLGKIVFIQFNGKSPVKRDGKIIVPVKDGPVTLSFPIYDVKPPRCRDSMVILQSGSHRREAAAELVEDINKIAVKNLEDRRGRVIAKTLARAVAKPILSSCNP